NRPGRGRRRPAARAGGRRGCRRSAPAAACSRPGPWPGRPPPAGPPPARPARAGAPPPGPRRRRRSSPTPSAGSNRSCGRGRGTRRSWRGPAERRVGHSSPRRRGRAVSPVRYNPRPPFLPDPAMAAPSWLYENFDPTGSAIGFRVTRKLDEVQSPFQKIEVFESTDWGNVMLIDGAMMVTSRDNFLYHEMMVHPALFTHPDPKHVVIIGGGDCGTLREVLRHPGVEQAVQCDIDEQVTRMAEKYFPELCESNGDPRAEVMFDDGIRSEERRVGNE